MLFLALFLSEFHPSLLLFVCKGAHLSVPECPFFSFFAIDAIFVITTWEEGIALF